MSTAYARQFSKTKPAHLPLPPRLRRLVERLQAISRLDDFEQQPLHGTFLIDRQGLVRWQDISYEPFTKVEFLLEESKRLLAQDPPQVTQR
ncbi:MAG: hypothetical protein CM1200mP29_07480 [Verrucomicrobiota bacterium]|nr:MAG: hypothetical protein CM1200mP29_07480 [Verrucomicrobiota bacterium]